MKTTTAIMASASSTNSELDKFISRPTAERLEYLRCLSSAESKALINSSADSAYQVVEGLPESDRLSALIEFSTLAERINSSHGFAALITLLPLAKRLTYLSVHKEKLDEYHQYKPTSHEAKKSNPCLINILNNLTEADRQEYLFLLSREVLRRELLDPNYLSQALMACSTANKLVEFINLIGLDFVMGIFSEKWPSIFDMKELIAAYIITLDSETTPTLVTSAVESVCNHLKVGLFGGLPFSKTSLKPATIILYGLVARKASTADIAKEMEPYGHLLKSTLLGEIYNYILAHNSTATAEFSTVNTYGDAYKVLIKPHP